MSSGLSLDQLGRDISGRLQRADDHMLAACIHLAEARQRVLVEKEAGETTWAKWCRENIKKKDGTPYSQSYLRKQLVIGKASDHQAALDELRVETRDSVARAREKEKRETLLRRSAPVAPTPAAPCALRKPAPPPSDARAPERAVDAEPAETAAPEDAHQDAADTEAEGVKAEVKAEPEQIAEAVSHAGNVEAEVEQIMSLWRKVSPAARKIAGDLIWEWEEPKVEPAPPPQPAPKPVKAIRMEAF